MGMAVGLIVHADQAEAILREGRADLIALARELMYNPNRPADAAQKLGVGQDFASLPDSQSFLLAKRAAAVKDMEPSRSEEHTTELPALMRSSYAVFRLEKTKQNKE